jgi:type II secretory pathway component PulF
MTIDQDTAIWEMRRQGLHNLAYEAEQRWENGKPVKREELAQATRQLWTLVERCNRQI